MAINGSATKRIANKRIIKIVETRLSTNFTLDEIKIDKILDGYANCQIDVVEKLGDQLNIAGKINFVSVFVDEEKILNKKDFSFDLNEKVAIIEDEAIFVLPRVKSIKQSKETSSLVEVSIILELAIYGLKSEQLVYLENNDEDYHKLTNSLVVENVVCSANSSFNVCENVEINEKVDKIIACYSRLVVNKVVPFDNYVVLDGVIESDLVYLTGEVVRKCQYKTEVNQEIALLNVKPETMLDVASYLAKVGVQTNVDEDGLKTGAEFNFAVTISLWGIEKEEICVINDIFSTKKELLITANSFNNLKTVETQFVSDRVSYIADVSDKKRLDEIVMLGRTTSEIDFVSPNGNCVLIEGKIKQIVIGKNYDNEEFYAINVEIPFSVNSMLPYEMSDVEVDVVLNARCSSYKNKAGRDISFMFDIDGVVSAKELICETYIKEVEEKESFVEDEYSITIYKPDVNEKLYDIAKRLKVDPKVIAEQNGEIVNGQEIKKIMVFR